MHEGSSQRRNGAKKIAPFLQSSFGESIGQVHDFGHSCPKWSAFQGRLEMT
jgi:hypothetical protein